MKLLEKLAGVVEPPLRQAAHRLGLHPNDQLDAWARTRAPYQELVQANQALAQENAALRSLTQQQYPPGHFYSPIPALAELRAREAEVFPAQPPRQLPGVDLNEAGQLALLEAFAPFRAELPFGEDQPAGLRSKYVNTMYCGSEGCLLYYVLRHLQPRRLIEIGSGFSSCFTLDTNELFLGGGLACTFIEPYPERLYGLLRPGDRERVEIIQSDLQAVPLEKFSALEANDILFVDSTHVSKAGSDVNYVLFRILPHLRSGVWIHIHDVFYPFEYPKEWLYQGISWNEDYLLRAFLQYNQTFEIAFFHDFMLRFHRERLLRDFPHLSWGQSLWLRKR